MARKIYPFNGQPPIPGSVPLQKNAGALGRQKLRIKKATRKARRRSNPSTAG